MIHSHPETAPGANPVNAGENFLGGNGAVESFARRQAIVAATAIVGLQLLTEILQQRSSPASCRLRKMRNPLQLLARHPLLLGSFLFNKLRVFAHAPRAENQQATTGKPVPPRPPRLLVV